MSEEKLNALSQVPILRDERFNIGYIAKWCGEDVASDEINCNQDHDQLAKNGHSDCWICGEVFEKQFTIEGMEEAFAAMDEPSKTTMPIMSPLNAALFLLADIRRAVGDTTGKLMQSELVAHCGEIYRESQLYRQMHKDWKENQGEMRRLKKCDKCGELVDIDHGSVHGKCNQVWGRRGWRTLGEYDG